jgi:hypothetical protein
MIVSIKKIDVSRTKKKNAKVFLITVPQNFN